MPCVEGEIARRWRICPRPSCLLENVNTDLGLSICQTPWIFLIRQRKGRMTTRKAADVGGWWAMDRNKVIPRFVLRTGADVSFANHAVLVFPFGRCREVGTIRVL